MVLSFTEKIHVLKKLPLGMSFSAVGFEFNVYDSTSSRKGRVNWPSWVGAAPESAGGPPALHGKAVEKREMWPKKKKKAHSGQHFHEAKSQRDLQSYYLDSRNVKLPVRALPTSCISLRPQG